MHIKNQQQQHEENTRKGITCQRLWLHKHLEVFPSISMIESWRRNLKEREKKVGRSRQSGEMYPRPPTFPLAERNFNWSGDYADEQEESAETGHHPFRRGSCFTCFDISLWCDCIQIPINLWETSYRESKRNKKQNSINSCEYLAATRRAATNDNKDRTAQKVSPPRLESWKKAEPKPFINNNARIVLPGIIQEYF